MATSSTQVCFSSFNTFSDFLSPDKLVHQCLVNQYEEYPGLIRCVAAPAALAEGMLKVPLFLVWAGVGVVALPIIAAVRYSQDQRDVSAWLGAWAISIVSVVGSVAFVVLMVNYLNLFQSTACLMVVSTVSGVIHVHRFMETPKRLPEIDKVIN